MCHGSGFFFVIPFLLGAPLTTLVSHLLCETFFVLKLRTLWNSPRHKLQVLAHNVLTGRGSWIIQKKGGAIF